MLTSYRLGGVAMHIAIEGMDGVGKTTAAHLLADRIGFRIIEKPLHYLIDEPGKMTNYVRCRDYINDQIDNDPLRAWFYGLGNLFLSHRFRREDVITDRHFLSNFYWCGGPQTEAIFKCLVEAAGKPDYTFLLHASIEEGRRRILKRDSRDPDVRKADLYTGSREKMEAFLTQYEMQYTAIDTTNLTPEQVIEAIMAALPRRICEKVGIDKGSAKRPQT